MDAVFKALGDDTRRQLLDMLRLKDGQTLSELEQQLGMTRFGVMKHLKILEEASLVVTRRSGRFKYHYLNAVPLQEVIDRWIEPLVQKPLSRMALDIKAQLEGIQKMDAKAIDKPDFVLETFIRTSAEKLWNALTKPEHVAHYHFAKANPSGEMVAGASVKYITPDGGTMLTFKVNEAEPMRRIDMIFTPGWMPDAASSRCVYEIEPQGDVCKLTILHFQIPEEQDGVKEGWARIAASLKSYLETGKGLFD